MINIQHFLQRLVHFMKIITPFQRKNQMKESAGILLFRRTNQIEVFLVHPGGPFSVHKNEGRWTVPKYTFDSSADPLTNAIRKFKYKINKLPKGSFLPLPTIIKKDGKNIFCWALEGDISPKNIKNNTFQIEWPLNSGKQTRFREFDRASWFPIDIAGKMINKRQVIWLNSLV